MSPDNLITNKQVDAGTLPESQRENRPQVSAEGQAAAKRIAAARAERNANPTSVTADQLSQPVSQVTVPQPQVAETTPVNQNMVRGVQSGTQNFITAQSEEATRLAESRQLQNDLLGEGTLSDFRTERENAFGIPENMRMLQDLDLQMADMDTESNITQTRIGQGNSIAQGNREITQEQRENAVRQAGTAARAAILQGNIETASALVSQAVQTAYQDRTLRNSNLINQINSLQGVVDGQTAQLLEADKREYEEDQAVIQRVADAVDDAMNSGAATQEDIRTLTDPKLSDEDRLAAAQGIVSRGQTQLRDLDVRQAEASIRSSNASAAVKAEQLLQLQEPSVVTRSTEIVDINGVKSLVDTQTGETIETFEAGTTTNQVEIARGTAFVNTIDSLKTDSGLNTSVGPTFLARTAGIDALSGAKDDFVASVENVVKTLTLNTFAEAKEKGMTFGAMSQGEWDILGDSATKISNFRVYEKEGIPGFRKTTTKVSGYDASQKDFLAELDSISNFAKMDALRRGSSPESIGVIQQEDGNFFTENSDGSFTQLDFTPIN